MCLAGYLGECHDLFGTAEKIPHTPEHANISVHKYGTIILILYSRYLETAVQNYCVFMYFVWVIVMLNKTATECLYQRTKIVHKFDVNLLFC